MTKEMHVGRLALRQEGNWWNAYYALRMDSMDGAIHLGSIAMQAVATNPEVKQAFMSTMRLVVAEIVKDATGITPKWKAPRPAPESERSGNA